MSGIEEYRPGDAFPGALGRTVEESSPAWPAPTRAREGAPNVLFFVLDDVGYGQLSSFGGLVETPNIDRVAAHRLRYVNMHTTALCSPTRSCILTGRNHHSNGVACIMELATDYPGYDGRMPFENGMLPEMLLDRGYHTFCVGKWHLSLSEDNTPAGPLHRWPLGRGFERFYGFLGGETNQWYPERAVQAPSAVSRGQRPPSSGRRAGSLKRGPDGQPAATALWSSNAKRSRWWPARNGRATSVSLRDNEGGRRR